MVSNEYNTDIKGHPMKNEDAVIKHLQHLASGGEPLDPHEGLCKELWTVFDRLTSESVMLQVDSWEHYSGSEEFPVPAYDGFADAEETYMESDYLWEGEGGKLRRVLCEHLANVLEKAKKSREFREAYPLHKDVVSRLRELGAGVASPVNVMYGVCHELYRGFHPDNYTVMIFPFQRDWPLFSGSDRYPIPHPSLGPRAGYNFEDNLWIGEYGEARKDFCLFLADKVEEAAGAYLRT